MKTIPEPRAQKSPSPQLALDFALPDDELALGFPDGAEARGEATLRLEYIAAVPK